MLYADREIKNAFKNLWGGLWKSGRWIFDGKTFKDHKRFKRTFEEKKFINKGGTRRINILIKCSHKFRWRPFKTWWGKWDIKYRWLNQWKRKQNDTT